MWKSVAIRLCVSCSICLTRGVFALDSGQAPGFNFDLSHWKLQLPTFNGVLTGTNTGTDSVSSGTLAAGFTNDFFYTGSGGAMLFWVPNNGARTSGSDHPRCELREQLVPGNDSVNWTLHGTHSLTATCVVSNVPSDTGKVCLGQIHEPSTQPDGSASANNEHLIMFDLPNQKIYANVNLDGDLSSSISTTFISGSGVALGKLITYTLSVVDGVLQMSINGVTNSWDFFSGTNYQGHIAQHWDAASGNTVYFKAGDYNLTVNTCNCSTDGARVAFYALTRYHAPSIPHPPVSVAAEVGTTARFEVGATGNGLLSYQWWFNTNGLLAGATNSALVISNVSRTTAGSYFVVVTDSTSSFSSRTSSVATLTAVYPHTTVIFTNAGTMTWTCPSGVTSLQVECWGGGGAGGSAFRTPNSGSVQYGGGGAGGAYARVASYAVIPGTTYFVCVGTGGVAATGTLVDNGTVPGGDSWFNNTNVAPVAAGGCLAKGGAGGQCAVGNTSGSASGTGGTGTTNGSIGEFKFSGGSGGSGSNSTGYGGSGGGSGGTGGSGILGGTNGLAASAVTGGGPGGAPNATGGSSGPGQSPTAGPGGGGGGARATSQQPGGNGASGRVVLDYLNYLPSAPAIMGCVLTSAPRSFALSVTGAANQPYVLWRASSLTPPVVWMSVATNTSDDRGGIGFTDATAPNLSQGFYRVSSP